jgi:hypothetical protein
VRRHHEDEVDHAGYGCQQAAGNACRRQVPAGRPERVVREEQARHVEQDGAGQERKGKRDQHWMQRMSEDLDLALHLLLRVPGRSAPPASAVV